MLYFHFLSFLKFYFSGTLLTSNVGDGLCLEAQIAKFGHFLLFPTKLDWDPVAHFLMSYFRESRTLPIPQRCSNIYDQYSWDILSYILTFHRVWLWSSSPPWINLPVTRISEPLTITTPQKLGFILIPKENKYDTILCFSIALDFNTCHQYIYQITWI